MTKYLTRSLRFYGLLALFPLVVGFISAWSAGFGFLLFVLGTPLAAGILLFGSVHWLVRGVRTAREISELLGKIFVIAAAPALAICVVLIAIPMLQIGTFGGTLTRLYVNQSSYEAIIAKARKEQKSANFATDVGITYSVDLGPPVRVAFNPEGMLDNWSGIIFDPTGEVMKADGFDANGKFYAPDNITKLFDGDLVSCRHLWGAYYACSFT